MKFIILAALLFSMCVELRSYSRKEQALDVLYGTGQLALAAANSYVAWHSCTRIHENWHVISPSWRRWLHEDKITSARWELLRSVIGASACTYLAYRCSLASIASFKKVAKNTELGELPKSR